MTSRVAPGAVVAWWDGTDLAFAVVVGEEKQRIRLILPGGKETRVVPTRVAFDLEPAGSAREPLRERIASGRRAEAAAERVHGIAASIDAALLWEIARPEGAEHDLGTLAALATGADSPLARAAVAVALLEDGTHFVRRSDSWEARSPAEVQEILHQAQREASRAAERQAAVSAFRDAVRGEPWRPTGNDAERRTLEALEDLAVRAADAHEASRALATEALDGAGIPGDRPSERAFWLLRKIGRFRSDDENLLVRRYRLRTEFAPEALDAARLAAARDLSSAGRADLTALDTITIDGPHTREIDDALSAERRPGGGWRLGVHIADPSAFVQAGDPADAEAFARATSHYLPDLRLPMLPPEISEGCASLAEGVARPAVSFLAELDGEGEILGFEIVRSVIRTRARLDYEGADRDLSSGSGPVAALLRDLLEVARTLEARRAARGALLLVAPEVEPHVASGGRIFLERHDPGSPSHRLVSEAMVFAGALAARFCADRGVPVLFRRQAPPASPIERAPGAAWDPVTIRVVRRALRRGEVSLQPGHHFALGLPAYTQVTSPLRRFQDLVAHRQILAALEGRSPIYGLEDLRRIAATTEAAEAEGRQAERAADLYWKLRYLEQEGARTVEAVVVDERPMIVQLAETLLEERVPGLVGAGLGERVTLRVERVNPRAELLVLRPVG